MHLKIILFLLLFVGIAEEKTWKIHHLGKSVSADTTNIADLFNGGSVANGDSVAILDTFTYIQPKATSCNISQNNITIYSKYGSAKNIIDTIKKLPGPAGQNLIYFNGTNLTCKNIAFGWKDTTADGVGSQFLINSDNNGSLTLKGCVVSVPRNFGVASGLRLSGVPFTCDSSILDSAQSYTYNTVVKATNSVFYRNSLNCYNGSVIKNCVMYKNPQWDLDGNKDTVINTFFMNDSMVDECLSYKDATQAQACSLNVVRYNYFWNTNHVSLTTDSNTHSDFSFNILQGSGLYNHCYGICGSNTYFNNVYKPQATLGLITYANTKNVSNEMFKKSIFFMPGGSQNYISFNSACIKDSVDSSAFFTTTTYPTITANYWSQRDTIKADSNTTMIEHTKYFYPSQRSSNKLIRSSSVVYGQKKFFINPLDTTAILSKTSKKFSVACSLDVNFRFANYTWNLNNQWFKKDSAQIYLQDSMSGTSVWRNVDSSKIIAGTRDTLTDSASGIASKKVSYRFVATAIVSTPFYDTSFAKQDSVTVPSSVSGPSVTNLIPDSTSVAGGYKVAINGTSLTGTTVKIGNGGYAGATSQTMTSVGSTVDTITTTAFSRGLYKVYVTDGSANVDSSKTIYFYKASLIYTPSSRTETQNVISLGYAATDSAVGDPWDSIGYKTALPIGLSLNHSTGAITGTPTVAQGATAYLFYAWKYGYKNDSATITITIISAPVTTVTSIVPVKAKTGDTVTINGSNFGSSQGGSTVKFGITLPSLYVSWSATQTKVVVPTLSRGHYLVHLCASNCDSSQILTLINLCDKPAIQLPINGATGVSITPALNSRRIK